MEACTAASGRAAQEALLRKLEAHSSLFRSSGMRLADGCLSVGKRPVIAGAVWTVQAPYGVAEAAGQSPARRLSVVAQATRGRRKSGSSVGIPGGSRWGGAGEEEDDGERHRRKMEALNDVINQINDEYGKGTIVPLDSATNAAVVDTFPTGVLPLDFALGGGWPKGRIVEIYGHESSGKTTLALYAIAQAQKLKQAVVFIDAEHALDMSYAKRLGVITEGPDRLIMAQPNSGEDAINIADQFVRSGHVSLIVVDSVSALVPQQEIEGNIGEGGLGLQARLMSWAARRLGPHASKANCTIIFLNQIRNKIGVYGNPETTSGGLALKFHASVRCETKVIERKRIASEDVGFRCRVRVVKSKVSVPYREAEFDLLHGQGVPPEAALLDTAEKLGVVAKRGSYYYIMGQVIQGKDRTAMYLKETPEVAAEIEKAVREGIRTGVATMESPLQQEGAGPDETADMDLALLEDEELGEAVDEIA